MQSLSGEVPEWRGADLLSGEVQSLSGEVQRVCLERCRGAESE